MAIRPPTAASQEDQVIPNLERTIIFSPGPTLPTSVVADEPALGTVTELLVGAGAFVSAGVKNRGTNKSVRPAITAIIEIMKIMVCERDIVII